MNLEAGPRFTEICKIVKLVELLFSVALMTPSVIECHGKMNRIRCGGIEKVSVKPRSHPAVVAWW